MVCVFAHFFRCLLARKPLPRNLLSVKDLKRIASEIEMHLRYSRNTTRTLSLLWRERWIFHLENTFILDVFKDHTWAPLFSSSVDVHHILVWEFFLNAVVEGDHLNGQVRGKEFTISTMSIQNFLQIRPVIPKSSLAYDKRKLPIVSVITPMLRGDRLKKCLLTTSFSPKMRTLAYIMIFNLSLPRALFLHDLFLKKDIDICAYIYFLLEKCVSKRTSRMTLPFPGFNHVHHAM